MNFHTNNVDIKQQDITRELTFCFNSIRVSDPYSRTSSGSDERANSKSESLSMPSRDLRNRSTSVRIGEPLDRASPRARVPCRELRIMPLERLKAEGEKAISKLPVVRSKHMMATM